MGLEYDMGFVNRIHKPIAYDYFILFKKIRAFVGLNKHIVINNSNLLWVGASWFVLAKDHWMSFIMPSQKVMLMCQRLNVVVVWETFTTLWWLYNQRTGTGYELSVLHKQH